MDKITEFLKNVVKGHNNAITEKNLKTPNKNLENQNVCYSCGARLKPNSSYCSECKTIVPLNGEALKLRKNLID